MAGKQGAEPACGDGPASPAAYPQQRTLGPKAMDYRIRKTKAELDSTGFMEIGPGRYSGEHWQEGFLFV